MHRRSNYRPATPAKFPAQFMEPLEGRQLYSTAASPVVQPDALIATTTSLHVSSATPLLGQTLTLTIRVTAASGTADPHGTIYLLSPDHETGVSGTLDHLGRATFTFGPGAALWAQTYNLRVRYAGNSSFAVSRSHIVGISVKGPELAQLSDGLEVATVTAGVGKQAKKGETLTVTYTGFLSDGTIFDESSSHTPNTFSFELDANPEQVIPGFDEGLAGMQDGETRVLVIPPNLGYGDSANGSIPADSTLIFVIQQESL
jgi:hypothetical protein